MNLPEISQSKIKSVNQIYLTVNLKLIFLIKSVVWPCNPENVLVAHKPDTLEIIRYYYTPFLNVVFCNFQINCKSPV